MKITYPSGPAVTLCGTPAQVWNHFQKFPPLYRRVRVNTMQIKKKQPKPFQSRLQKLIKNTKKGVMHGEWNDNDPIDRCLRTGLSAIRQH
ncbi:MAG: YdeI/OmpD-associated family protein [Lachnospiraceae bacterium]|nr:YdeI/OmpD-associated family protein [Lachnospiraceae bacterium]